MLWGSSLKLIKKIASSIVLGAGILVLVSATLKTIFVIVVSDHASRPSRSEHQSSDIPYPKGPVNGTQIAGQWGTREAFVAVFTINLPMIFLLLNECSIRLDRGRRGLRKHQRARACREIAAYS